MTGVVFALVLVAGTPPSCDRAALLEDVVAGPPDAAARLERALDGLPGGARGVGEQVRALEGRGVPLDERLAMARVALGDLCAPVEARRAAALSAKAAALMKDDARFGGVRAGDDVVDRALHKLWLALAGLLESDGMRRYAGSARVVYFVALVVVVLVVALRLLRALQRGVQREAPAAAVGAQRRLEAQRRRAFASWRAEAGRALDSGDARAALRAGQAALLVRIGEVTRGAVSPARTHRELVARLERPLADALGPTLATFDRCFFAGPATLDQAREFLAQVDETERSLPRAWSPAGAPGSGGAVIGAALPPSTGTP